MQQPQRIRDLEAELPPGDLSQYDIAVMLPELEKLEAGSIYMEIGVQWGRSLYLAAKYSKAQAYGVDIQPTLCSEWLNKEDLPYEYSWGGSDNAAGKWRGGQVIDVLFIDGDHRYEGVKKDIENWLPFVKKGGVIFFHDFDETSPGVVQAVNEAFKKVETFKETVGNTSIGKVVVK